MIDEFNNVQKLEIINTLGQDMDRHLSLVVGNLKDLYTAFSILGLETGNLEKVADELAFTFEHIEYCRNIASFGTTGNAEVDLNLKESIEEFKLEKEILTEYKENR